ncbi:unnamed protein product, partial [Arctogadus glacialis]
MLLLGSANKQGLSVVASYHRCNSQHCLPLADRGRPSLEPGRGTRGSPHVRAVLLGLGQIEHVNIERGKSVDCNTEHGAPLLLAQGARGWGLLTGPSHLSQRSLDDSFQAYWRGSS